MSTVVLGVTGCISAYKACEITRLLVKSGHEVRVMMTRAATRFVTPLTFQTLSQNPVMLDLFEPREEWMPKHIDLANRADVMVLAPCSADMIAKVVHGIADDLVSSTVLANHAPLLVAPSMNTFMWKNPSTQSNVQTLLQRGITLVDADEGPLACGTTGKGRLADPRKVVDAIECVLKEKKA